MVPRANILGASPEHEQSTRRIHPASGFSFLQKGLQNEEGGSGTTYVLHQAFSTLFCSHNTNHKL